MQRKSPSDVVALGLPQSRITEEQAAYFSVCEEKLGFVPNVLTAYSFDSEKLDGFTRMYNELMLGESGLSKLEREIIAVVVSSINHCFYCLASHGAAVRKLSGNPALGDEIAANFRAAGLTARQHAMCEFAAKMTEQPERIAEADRQLLRDAGLSDRDIWDLAAVASFFNMSNRMSIAVDMRPNDEYHGMAR
ncbi:MAG: peroxidase-related enzyme [Pseudomonadota bacterium]